MSIGGRDERAGFLVDDADAGQIFVTDRKVPSRFQNTLDATGVRGLATGLHRAVSCPHAGSG